MMFLRPRRHPGHRRLTLTSWLPETRSGAALMAFFLIGFCCLVGDGLVAKASHAHPRWIGHLGVAVQVAGGLGGLGIYVRCRRLENAKSGEAVLGTRAAHDIAILKSDNCHSLIGKSLRRLHFDRERLGRWHWLFICVCIASIGEITRFWQFELGWVSHGWTVSFDKMAIQFGSDTFNFAQCTDGYYGGFVTVHVEHNAPSHRELWLPWNFWPELRFGNRVPSLIIPLWLIMILAAIPAVSSWKKYWRMPQNLQTCQSSALRLSLAKNPIVGRFAAELTIVGLAIAILTAWFSCFLAKWVAKTSVLVHESDWFLEPSIGVILSLTILLFIGSMGVLCIVVENSAHLHWIGVAAKRQCFACGASRVGDSCIACNAILGRGETFEGVLRMLRTSMRTFRWFSVAWCAIVLSLWIASTQALIIFQTQHFSAKLNQPSLSAIIGGTWYVDTEYAYDYSISIWERWLHLRIETPATSIPLDVNLSNLFGWSIVMTVLTFRFARRQYRHQECHCCGYNLTGNTTGICPECGITLVPSDEAGRPK